ncbi:hypothetical protein AB0C29_15410 [Actinoplanes sp. NPDC048791]|uniref:hypothetical protein n=1 Tax=Actinoplanes sp. NPDC048791 TaxID=3154623 RepID=UPI0033D0EDAD
MITTTARRRDAGLLTMAMILATAFFLAPPLLFGPGRLGDFPRAFVGYWSSGSPDFRPDLQYLVDYQFHYHLARVVIALPLLVVLVTLAVLHRRFRPAIGTLALVAAVLLIANVQGAVSPFGTLLPILASGPADADLIAVLAQIRDQLHNGPTSPALDVMLDEYVRWHVAKGLLVGLLAAVLIGLSVVTWRRRRRWLSLLTAVAAMAALVVVAANATTVMNPSPPLLLLLQGSW